MSVPSLCSVVWCVGLGSGDLGIVGRGRGGGGRRAGRCEGCRGREKGVGADEGEEGAEGRWRSFLVWWEGEVFPGGAGCAGGARGEG